MAATAASFAFKAVPHIAGRVVLGRKLGRQLGFPTANIDAYISRLSKGVYGVVVKLRETNYLGVMNIGVKPTIDSSLQKNAEIFLFDFHENIYGEFLECDIFFKIREEKKFASFELLKQQIKEDVLYAEEYFKRIGLIAKSQ